MDFVMSRKRPEKDFVMSRRKTWRRGMDFIMSQKKNLETRHGFYHVSKKKKGMDFIMSRDQA